jgi:hypothetical protein
MALRGGDLEKGGPPVKEDHELFLCHCDVEQQQRQGRLQTRKRKEP